MTPETIFKTMQDLIAEQFAIEADEVTMDSSFVDDLGADSVDLVELVMAMEEEFDIGEIDEEDLQTLKTVGDCVRYLSRHIDCVCRIDIHVHISTAERETPHCGVSFSGKGFEPPPMGFRTAGSCGRRLGKEEMMEVLQELEERLGYMFHNIELLRGALYHSSYANEHRSMGISSNERLEFLGDAVLGFVSAEFLYRKHPDLPEGELTRIRAALVCEESLHEVAQSLGLGSYLRLGKGEEMTGGRTRPSIIADAFEALIAAIYLDSGIESARSFVLPFVIEMLEHEDQLSFKDYKTILQEIIQQNPEERLVYKLVGEHGPDHDKRFVVDVMLNSNVIGKGEGRSKKNAEQMAAKEALELMGR